MENEKIKATIDKLIAHVLRNDGNERENAERVLRNLCKKHDINYDDLFLKAGKKEEYVVKVNDKGERRIFMQVLYAYGEVEDISHYRYAKIKNEVIFEATRHKYLEAMGVFEILQRAYRKEKKEISKTLAEAFIHKYRLYSKSKPDDEKREWTDEEMEAYKKALRMAGAIDDVQITKQLENGNQN